MTCFSPNIEPLSVEDIAAGVGFSLAKMLLFILFLSILYIKNLCVNYDMKNIDRKWTRTFHQSNTSATSVVEIQRTLDQLQSKQVILFII